MALNATAEKNKNTAKVGDYITFYNGCEGIVDKLLENSAIVLVTKTVDGLKFGNDKTVVNRKEYKILKK